GDTQPAAGATIAGRVVDAADRPVAGAEVRLQQTMGWKVAGPDGAAMIWQCQVNSGGSLIDANVHSGADGSFALAAYRADTATAYDVLARADGLDADMAGNVSPGRQDLLLRLQPLATWTLRVVDDADGSPLSGVTVRGCRVAGSFEEGEVAKLEGKLVDGGWQLCGAS